MECSTSQYVCSPIPWRILWQKSPRNLLVRSIFFCNDEFQLNTGFSFVPLVTVDLNQMTKPSTATERILFTFFHHLWTLGTINKHKYLFTVQFVSVLQTNSAWRWLLSGELSKTNLGTKITINPSRQRFVSFSDSQTNGTVFCACGSFLCRRNARASRGMSLNVRKIVNFMQIEFKGREIIHGKKLKHRQVISVFIFPW